MAGFESHSVVVNVSVYDAATADPCADSHVDDNVFILPCSMMGFAESDNGSVVFKVGGSA